MDLKSIRGKDLNLLVSLKALLDERSVSGAARRLGVSQPAMSRNLKQLRGLLGDQVLIRTPKGYEPTAHGRYIEHALDRVLSEVALIAERPVFDRLEETGEIRIGGFDSELGVLLPEVVATLRREAPGVTVRAESLHGHSLEPLERGQIDVAVLAGPNVSMGYFRRKLMEEDRVCVLARDSRAALGQLTLDAFAELDHVSISVAGVRRSIIDDTLARHSLGRRVVAHVPDFRLGASLAENSDLALCIPRHMALQISRAGTLVIREIPFELPPIVIYQYWHERQDKSARHIWLRSIIQHSAARLSSHTI